jgi:polyferredoxin
LLFLFLWFGAACPFMVMLDFTFCVKKSLNESFVVVALWSHIVLVSAYHGRLLLLHLFFNDSFAG